MSKFTDKLELCYKARNYDRVHFANKIGVPESTIRSWIRIGNYPPADILYKISKFFGVPMEYFMDGGESSFSDKEIALILKMRKLKDEQIKMLYYMVEKFENDNKKIPE